MIVAVFFHEVDWLDSSSQSAFITDGWLFDCHAVDLSAHDSSVPSNAVVSVQPTTALTDCPSSFGVIDTIPQLPDTSSSEFVMTVAKSEYAVNVADDEV